MKHFISMELVYLIVPCLINIEDNGTEISVITHVQAQIGFIGMEAVLPLVLTLFILSLEMANNIVNSLVQLINIFIIIGHVTIHVNYLY